MSLSPQTRKPIDSLTLADLAVFPIWEYADDEEGFDDRDETWVRPVDAKTVPRHSYTTVAASFQLACGREYKGSVAVSRLDEPPDIFSGVLYDRDSFFLIPGPDLAHFDRAMTELLNGLGLSEAELFPIRFTLEVCFEGESECQTGSFSGRQVSSPQSSGSDDSQMKFW